MQHTTYIKKNILKNLDDAYEQQNLIMPWSTYLKRFDVLNTLLELDFV